MRFTKVLIFTAFFCAALVPVLDAQVVTKIVVQNPSDKEPRRVVFKSYLPQNVGYDRMISTGGLDVAYDTEQGGYYLYGRAELSPGELREYKVELKNMWAIPEADLQRLDDVIQKCWWLAERASNSQWVGSICRREEEKLRSVVLSQQLPGNLEQSRSLYLENQKVVASIEKEMAYVEKLAESHPLNPAILGGIVIAAVLFGGFLVASFYLFRFHMAQEEKSEGRHEQI